jgi:hypothetical protein
MSTLTAAAPHLLSLNLSWLAMVGDSGLQQLAPLSELQELDLRSTSEAGTLHMSQLLWLVGCPCTKTIVDSIAHTVVLHVGVFWSMPVLLWRTFARG